MVNPESILGISKKNDYVSGHSNFFVNYGKNILQHLERDLIIQALFSQIKLTCFILRRFYNFLQ